MMKTIYLLLSLFFLQNYYSQQGTFFGNIPDLVYKQSNVFVPVESDTIAQRIFNFHFVKDTMQAPYLLDAQSRLNELSIFMVGNKFGGEDKVIYGKIGSALVTSNGIYDYADTLKIESSTPAAKIITYGKRDKSKGNFVYLPKSTDKTLLNPELLIFKRNLSKKEKQQVESYLSIKYGISINYLSEKNYLSSTGDAVWNYKKNKKYSYRITGIARDDSYGLYQKQSQNTDDNVLAVSLQNIKDFNSQNTGSLNDREFFLWGDNNQDVQFKEADLLSYHPHKDLKRLWKAQIKAQDSLKTSLYFNLKDVSTDDNIPRLKIYRTTENYENEIYETFSGEKLSDSLYVYKNVSWDTDHNNTDYFTLNNDLAEEADISIVSDCSELQNGLIKIKFPDNFSSYTYTLVDLKTNDSIVESQSSNSNPLVLNNLAASRYQLIVKKSNQPDIVRNFDIQDISNQNIEDNYLWEGEPIELDLNTDSYQYTLTAQDGSVTDSAPYLLNGIGEYTLNVKNKIGCTLQKTLYVLNQADYASKMQSSAFKEILLYPNPSHDGNINIKVVLKTPKNVTIQIFNALGVLLKEAYYEQTDNVDAFLNIPAVVGYYNVKILIPEESKGYNLIIN
ncbi:MAG: T9SS type A sorting domain-containing protein [Bergeyella sp.]